MHEPLSDNLMSGDREPVLDHRRTAPAEREVRLSGTPSPAEAFRTRVEGAFYHTPAIADIVARRILARGDL
jgi:hypothetical protein